MKTNTNTQLLVYTDVQNLRVTYAFKHICTTILGLEIAFTSVIEEFIAFQGMKLSYGKKRLGKQLFIQQGGLLWEHGISPIDVFVFPWEETKCFYKSSEESDLPFDIFSASFYLLSRYEEYTPHVKDSVGRFPVEESLAYKHKFLRQPVIDIWANKFKKLLQQKYPSKKFPEPQFENINILTIHEAYKYKKKGIVRNVGAGFRDIVKLQFYQVLERLQVISFIKDDPYDIYKEFVRFSKKEKIAWNYMFQLSDYSIYNKNISYHKISYRTLIKSLGDYGVLGLLPGYEALGNLAVLKKEKQRWEHIVNRPLQRLLIVNYGLNLPNYYNNCEKLELAQDYSMFYPEHIGFRAGTSFPFFFYDISMESISPLRIFPMLFSSMSFENLTFFEVKKTLMNIKEEMKKNGGNFGLVFANKDFEHTENRQKYLSLIHALNQ